MNTEAALLEQLTALLEYLERDKGKIREGGWDWGTESLCHCSGSPYS